ncbi:MAG: peptide-methionine (S)-S-oxide reductase MsrA [Asticcacaulis sp.]
MKIRNFAVALCAVAMAGSASADAVRETAVFAGGCFWSMQKVFDHVNGVTNTEAGFMGGHVKNPSYEDVTTETTGHLEAVKVTFDPSKVTYQQLLDQYWHHIDPTDPNGQICDYGPSYHTAVFTFNNGQYAAANASKQAVASELHKTVATQVIKASSTALPFYPAEAYHQHFATTHALNYQAYFVGCGRGPKLHAIWGKLAD